MNLWVLRFLLLGLTFFVVGFMFSKNAPAFIIALVCFIVAFVLTVVVVP